MEPEEWERLADEAAVDLRAEIDGLESACWPEQEVGSLHRFWPQVKEINERVRVAPAIKLDDKLALQRRLNELCQRARQDQKRLQQERIELERSIGDAIALARDALDESTTIADIQEVRADLGLVRERIERSPRIVSQAMWPVWQSVNQSAWARLNELWGANEAVLTARLDEADQLIEVGDVRAAKEAIKSFHGDVATRECSHRALRALRTRAAELWHRADQLGRDKHSRFLEQAAKRVDYWKREQQRFARTRSVIEYDIDQLEQRAAAAATDVGAALIRGQLEERRKALSDLDAEEQTLMERIEAAETALQRG